MDILEALRALVPEPVAMLGTVTLIWATFSLGVRVWYRVLVRQGQVRPLIWPHEGSTSPRHESASQLELAPGARFRVRRRQTRGVRFHDASARPIQALRAALPRIFAGLHWMPRVHCPADEGGTTLELQGREREVFVRVLIPDGAVCHVRARAVEGHSEPVGGLGIARHWARPLAWSQGLTGLLRFSGRATLVLRARRGVVLKGPGEQADSSRVLALLGSARVRAALPAASGGSASPANLLWGEVQIEVLEGALLCETVAADLADPGPLRAFFRLLWKLLFPLP